MGRGDHVLPDGQLNCERRSFVEFTLNRNRTAVSPNDSVTHSQPQSRTAIFFRREKWLETTPQRFFRHSRAGVRNIETNAFLVCTRAKGKLPAFGHCVHGVENQVRQHFA